MVTSVSQWRITDQHARTGPTARPSPPSSPSPPSLLIWSWYVVSSVSRDSFYRETVNSTGGKSGVSRSFTYCPTINMITKQHTVRSPLPTCREEGGLAKYNPNHKIKEIIDSLVFVRLLQTPSGPPNQADSSSLLSIIYAQFWVIRSSEG